MVSPETISTFRALTAKASTLRTQAFCSEGRAPRPVSWQGQLIYARSSIQ